jgi:hypothetical protein
MIAGAAAMKGISIIDARSLDSPPSIYQVGWMVGHHHSARF